jgi:hypothetical protein
MVSYRELGKIVRMEESTWETTKKSSFDMVGVEKL